jgi:hypothetical protein
VDEVALIRDTIGHYAPVLIAPLSIQIRRAGVQKKDAWGADADGKSEGSTALGSLCKPLPSDQKQSGFVSDRR